MSARIIDGKLLAMELRSRLAEKVSENLRQGHRRPGLAVIQIGQDAPSKIYVQHKKKACEEAGFYTLSFGDEAHITQAECLALIQSLNVNPEIDGILLQLPLPTHLCPQTLIETIDPNKDVDGFHPINLGRLVERRPLFQPCTTQGILKLLQHTQEPLAGKHAVIVGSSFIVGKPTALSLLLEKCTVTVCHSATKNLEAITQTGDILISATGSPGLIKGSWIKDGAIVIDVGITRLQNGKLLGDVVFDEAERVASWLTPVPGGVGPMTVASLLENTFLAYEKNLGRQNTQKSAP